MRITYKGPGDSVELDGLTIKKGEAVEVTNEQYTRLVASDPAAKVGVVSEKTADEERIRDSQAKAREREVKAADRAAREAS